MSGPPQPKDEGVRARLRAQQRKDTVPELALRRELHRRGLRYRTGQRVPGLARRTIDIAFTRARIAVFVDGCFWHGCSEHFVPPRNNAQWWAAKIDANRLRDLATTKHLTTAGWLVLRFWEHEEPVAAADRVQQEWRRRRSTR